MNEGFQFLDIIFLAMVAGFIALRLRGVLGRRTGNERPPRNPQDRRRFDADSNEDNVVALDNGRTDQEKAPRQDADADADEGSSLQATLTRIMVADRSFSVASFIGGARAAYRVIVTAFAAGDKATLNDLLNDQVCDDFSNAIDKREKQNQTAMAEIEEETSTELVGATFNGKVARVTIEFVSRLIRATKDSDGELVEGHPTLAQDVTDIWTFSREVKDSNPNWLLVSTRGAD